MCQDESISKSLAPEDITIDDYVAIVNIVGEFPAFMMCVDRALVKPDELVRISYIPTTPSKPLRVVSICLPFVFVRRPDGKHTTLDVRRHRLARLGRAYGRAVFKTLKKAAAKKPANSSDPPIKDEC